MTKDTLVEVLRARILRGLHAGTLAPGDRLPSAREAGAEFSADHRLVLAAYRDLAAEKLVEIRQRTGIYVARRFFLGADTPGLEWLIDTLHEGLARDVPIVRLHEWFQRIVLTRRLRAVLVEGTLDQIEGICYELRADYGFDARGLDAGDLADPAESVLADLAQADLLITTRPFAALVRRVGERVHVPVIVAEIGLNPMGGDWRQLLREPLHLVLGDERSIPALTRRFEEFGCTMENLHIVVVGRDDVSAIPADGVVYVTRGAARALGSTPIPGHHVPPARGFTSATARALIDHVVRANVDEAFVALGVPPVGPRSRPRQA
ncbi:MAG: GntR family transcriptional regulator [Gemmatimonadaceae bacterium]|nr:GntR family transcriptional regulator [Gemmatimonadaceae bacterium]NUQ93958.1 GntR family transcriptional regulator [Gemmatimonadaceae bacterium]NUR18322.1 GntR family transcriptional regulator [Gemmatimonadaceae bacterium]